MSTDPARLHPLASAKGPRRRAFVWAAALLIAGLALISRCASHPINADDATTRHERLAADARRWEVCRRGLLRLLNTVRDRRDLFPPEAAQGTRLLSPDQRRDALELWRAVLDHHLALDQLARYHEPFFRVRDQAVQRTSFLLHQAAYLAQYRFALEFIDQAEKNPALTVLLDEPVVELGLAEGEYGRYKFRFLNVARAAEFAALTALDKAWNLRSPAALVEASASDRREIWNMGKGRGEALTFENGWKIVQAAGKDAWFPLQSGIAEWMGDTRLGRSRGARVSPEQIEMLRAQLEPGDYLLTRREGYLSNIGLPGFWPHAALHVGTSEQRRAFFGSDIDPEVGAWVRAQGVGDGQLETLLSQRAQAAQARSAEPLEDGHPARVLEAMSEGVVFTSIEHCAAADSVAALRPRRSRLEKARAVLRAFGYWGRPYDFDFDFRTDAQLVCTELVYKAYEPEGTMRGLDFSVVQILGRPVLPANIIVRQFDERCGSEQQHTDLIYFFDGDGQGNQAVRADLGAFRASWKRPRWRVLPSKP